MRLDEIQLLIATGRGSASQIQDAFDQIYRELEHSGSTHLFTALDICHTRICAMAVGLFSLYESRLQSKYGLESPFDKLETQLANFGSTNQLEEFKDFRAAINVLKHGKGRSHSNLLVRGERLPFKVQEALGALVVEGDVCPPSDLILVSTEFLELCCEIIEKSWAIVLREDQSSESRPNL